MTEHLLRTLAPKAEWTSHEPQVLKPFHRSEAYTIAEAAAWARKSPRTVREWCMRFDIGRRIGGRWMVSRVALQMLLDGEYDPLKLYLAGNRHCESVIRYFAQLGVPLPRRAVIGTQTCSGDSIR